MNSSTLKGALAGTLAGAVALATGEFLGALATPRPGPVTAVANRVIDEAPTWFVNFGKDLFGLADKPALIVGTVLIALIVATVLGVASLRRPIIGIAGIAAFGVLGWVAIAVDAQGSIMAGLWLSGVSAALGIVTLLGLRSIATAPAVNAAAGAVPEAESMVNPAVSRRSFLGWAGIAGGGAVAGGVAAKALRSRGVAETARAEVELAATAEAAPVAEAVATATSAPVAQTPGITPIVVPNDDFYRIDTALLIPQVDPEDWQLTIRGMVDNELTFTYQDLLERATTVEPVTLSCVSNEVGGGLVGNAIWRGVPLTDLLDEAGVQPGATQIASHSVDGWNCGFPTDLAYDGRIAMVAVAMNDEPLPIRHGFPARLVVSGLYGYVSATKWLDTIELTTLDAFNGYWIPRGWSKDGPVKTQSRIDTPRAAVTAGESVPIAGVAWAPNSGIERVEVQIDGGEWVEATLGESLGVHAWRQWRLDWTPTAGDHQLKVRATDASGVPQIEERTPVAPDGASGWHTVNVQGR